MKCPHCAAPVTEQSLRGREAEQARKPWSLSPATRLYCPECHAEVAYPATALLFGVGGFALFVLCSVVPLTIQMERETRIAIALLGTIGVVASLFYRLKYMKLKVVATPRDGERGHLGTRQPVILGPGEGRSYPMGRISAVFKADGAETAFRYNVSEWWLEPHTKGPGAHAHPKEDCIFYVLAGTMSVLVGNDWVDGAAGTFILVPGGVTHDFENRGDAHAGVLNFSAPGAFEPNMPEIAKWFAEHPPQNT